MKNLLGILIMLASFEKSIGQLPDSTLESVFEHLQLDQLRQLVRPSNDRSFSNLTNDCLTELSFKIPILNPISNLKVNSRFGFRIHPISGAIKKHQGIDIAGKSGQPIYAAADGFIVETGYHKFLGNYVKIKHLLNFVTLYGHLQEVVMHSKNPAVYQGQIIGTCGSTGRTTGVHLHFSILWKNEFLNPYSYIF